MTTIHDHRIQNVYVVGDMAYGSRHPHGEDLDNNNSASVHNLTGGNRLCTCVL